MVQSRIDRCYTTTCRKIDGCYTVHSFSVGVYMMLSKEITRVVEDSISRELRFLIDSGVAVETEWKFKRVTGEMSGEIGELSLLLVEEYQKRFSIISLLYLVSKSELDEQLTLTGVAFASGYVDEILRKMYLVCRHRDGKLEGNVLRRLYREGDAVFCHPDDFLRVVEELSGVEELLDYIYVDRRVPRGYVYLIPKKSVLLLPTRVVSEHTDGKLIIDISKGYAIRDTEKIQLVRL